MSSPIFDGDPSNYAREYNDRNKHLLNENAAVIRLNLIQGVFRTFQELLIMDIDTRERIELPRFTLWLTDDTLESVAGEKGVQRSMAFAVAPTLDRSESERLRMHVPLPSDFVADSVDNVETLEAPSAVYAERIIYGKRRVGRTAVRYAIDGEHTYVYESIGDTQTDERMYPDDEALHGELYNYRSGISLLVGIQEDLVNWHQVPQTLIVRSDGINPRRKKSI